LASAIVCAFEVEGVDGVEVAFEEWKVWSDEEMVRVDDVTAVAMISALKA
jgi:hypothetical protein